MAVLLRRTTTIKGKTYPEVDTYVGSSSIITEDERKEADKLDHFINERVQQLRDELKEENLLKKNLSSEEALKLNYRIGEKLQFINDTDRINPGDRKHIWEAIWYHFRNLIPEVTPRRPREHYGADRDQFVQRYKLGQLNWDIAKNGGTWTEWVEFFDSRTISQDSRILDWILSNSLEREGWLSSFYRVLKKEWQNKDTTVFSNKELKDRLQSIWEKHA